MKDGQIIKSYLCQEKSVNLLYLKSKNCYVVEYNGKILKVFSRETAIQAMESYAMKCIMKITDNKKS